MKDRFSRRHRGRSPDSMVKHFLSRGDTLVAARRARRYIDQGGVLASGTMFGLLLGMVHRPGKLDRGQTEEMKVLAKDITQAFVRHGSRRDQKKLARSLDRTPTRRAICDMIVSQMGA